MSRRFLVLLITTVTIGLLSRYSVEAQESSWIRVFDNYYLSSIETVPWGILTGEFDTRIWMYPYNGVYISKDLGQTWEEFGLKDKGITNIKYSDPNIYVTTYYHTDTPAGLYISKDMGNTWEHSGPPYSSNYIEVFGNTILLGTTAHGLFVSQDGGVIWEQKILEIKVKLIEKIENTITVFGDTKTFESSDEGNTWKEKEYQNHPMNEEYKNYTYEIKLDTIYEDGLPTNLNRSAQDISVTYTSPPYLYASVIGEGIYKYEIPQIKLRSQPFLQIPWEYEDDNELTDKITAYFDHEYPLLGYLDAQEPSKTKNTTVNFLGIKEQPPLMYYSSHNGTDYALPYGTSIYAPAEGIARYFWCNDCGNSIEIDHQNGYKTIYMHLQDSIGLSKTLTTAVLQGQYLGKVGTTGNTTGPHLHFSVKKDNIVVDPYGWQNTEYTDPWEIYSWENSLGKYFGTQSEYLWENQLHKVTGLINDGDYRAVKLDNKEVSFDNINSPIGYILTLSSYIHPNVIENLKYISNTSILVEAVNLLGKSITQLPTKAKISFELRNLNILDVLSNTLKIYTFNKNLNVWEPLETFIDITNNLVYGYTSHFSQFAVFGEIDYSNHYFSSNVKVNKSKFVISY